METFWKPFNHPHTQAKWIGILVFRRVTTQTFPIFDTTIFSKFMLWLHIYFSDYNRIGENLLNAQAFSLLLSINNFLSVNQPE